MEQMLRGNRKDRWENIGFMLITVRVMGTWEFIILFSTLTLGYFQNKKLVNNLK